MLGQSCFGQLAIGQPDDNGQTSVVTPVASTAEFSWSVTSLAEFSWLDDNGRVAQFSWE